MAAIWLRFRTEMRNRWRGTLALVLLLGFVGSIVLAAAAGARRTSTAPDRLVAAVGGEGDAHIFDVGIPIPNRIRGLPQVEHSVAVGSMLADSVPLSGGNRGDRRSALRRPGRRRAVARRRRPAGRRANLAAAVPGWLAVRIRPAEALWA
jgi:hypothetical protein